MTTLDARPPHREERVRPGALILLPIVLAALLTLLVAGTAHAWPFKHSGRWSNPREMGNTAVQMALLRMPGVPYDATILWWHDSPGGAFYGGRIGWVSVDDTSCATIPDANFSFLAGVPDPGFNVFCAGLTHLSHQGRLAVFGGTSIGEFGVPNSTVYNAITNNWTAQPSMHRARWYPSILALSDGRLLAGSGNRFYPQFVFGGTANATDWSTPTDSLFLLGLTVTGDWLGPLTQIGADPDPVSGASVAYLNARSDVYVFGGRLANGQFSKRNLWPDYNAPPLNPDYDYIWDERGTAPIPLKARAEHVAAMLSDNTMVIYGGFGANPPATVGDTLSDVWRMRQSGTDWIWAPHPSEAAPGTGDLPGARLGHAAVYDALRNRTLVFGGATNEAGTLADNEVWEMTIQTNPPKAIWRKLIVTGPKPSARFGHTLVKDPATRKRASVDVHRALLFGGRTGASTYSDELWTLFIDDATGALQWQQMSTSGDPAYGNTKPTSRADHSAIYDESTHRMVLLGGSTGGASDRTTWAADVGCNTCLEGTIPWRRLADLSSGRSRHTAWYHGSAIFARESEVFTPEPAGPGSWELRADAPLTQDYFPFNFVMPQPGVDTVFTAGPAVNSYQFRIAGGPWTAAGSSGFVGGSSAMYLPGKVIKCGTRDSGPEHTALTTTKTIDLAPGQRTWQSSGNMTWGRVNHNLTLLPDGEVLVTGGTSVVGNHVPDPSARRQPELWSPSQGAWYGGGAPPDVLALDPMVRDYHSVAVLLPDARVLVAGGQNDADQRTKATVYSPPYLFDSEGRVVGSPGCQVSRPVITGSIPSALDYGQAFVIPTSTAGTITKVCLIKPGAATHGYDEGQRHVPLAFTPLPDYSGVRAVVPITGNQAPPGDYLLFLVNSDGVPSIARWVWLGSCTDPPCDTDSPPKVTGLYADIVGPSGVWLVWYAPGDDTSPVAGEYDLRYSAGGLASEQAYAEADQASDEPVAAPAGTPLNFTVDGLASCTEYRFALKTSDGTGNWSLLSNTATGITTCGGGGGGFAAERVDGAREGGGSSTVAVAPLGDAMSGSGAPLTGPAAVSSLDSGVLQAETRQTPEGGWQVTLRRLAQAEGVDGADAGAIVSQVPEGAGGWKTLGRYQPKPGQSPLGLCALRDQGRVVFPSGYALDRVVSGIKAGAQVLTLSLASHSRLGSLSGELAGGGGSVEMALGDALTLNYSPSGTALPGAASWYLLVRPTGGSEASATPARRALETKIPARFALRQNQPNPFRRTTTIAFDLPVKSSVTLEVFDLLGRKMATIAQGEHPAGAHTVEWDLRGAGGALLRAGIYVYRLRAGTFEDQRKLTVLP
jgi:galactose oxidase-like protein